MGNPARTLPDFTDPPVIETVLGVQFVSLEQFYAPHFGLYWEKIRADYPRAEVQPPLGQVIEQFGSKSRVGPAIEIGFVPGSELRCWFIDQSQNQLIQVQKDRFILNWRKVTGEELYPHYDYIKPKFKAEWERFCLFLNEEKMPPPDVNQCEVTYVNHIEVDKGWKSYGELNKVIACWSGTSSGKLLQEPEKVLLNVRYLMPEEKGRLYVVMQPAIRRRDGKEVLQLNLTARGKPNSSRLEDILEWLDLGRKWIVQGFTDFTTQEMHKIWGRTI